MYPFFRSLLFRLEPEFAHSLTLNALRFAGSIPLSRWILQALYKSPSKPTHVFGLDFKNPIGLAAGYDKDGIAIRGLATLGFGHIEIGTVTPLPQPGNLKPRLFRLIDDEAVINRMGSPSRGTEFVQSRLNSVMTVGMLQRFIGMLRKKSSIGRRSFSAILGVNIGRNTITPNEKAVYDYLVLLHNFAPLADYLSINISSPNTEGLRHLQKRVALENLLTHLHQQQLIEQNQLRRRVPLLVKLAPDLNDKELDDAVDAILCAQMDGIIATNTTTVRQKLSSGYQNEIGGLSGSPLRIHNDVMLQKIIKRVGSKIPVVSVGGIMSPEDAHKRLDMGAALVQVYTGLVYAGPGLVKQIVQRL